MDMLFFGRILFLIDKKNIILDHIPSCRVGRKLGVELLLNQMVRIINTFHGEREIMFFASSSISVDQTCFITFLQIEIVKEEFNEHLEVVDKINQICKNLQFHLNKMRTFEEPPFEKEANVIVDRWLDVSDHLIDRDCIL